MSSLSNLPKHKRHALTPPSNIGTIGGNTPRTNVIPRQQQQQPIVPNNNAPSQPNSPPTSSPPQVGSSNIQNTVPPGVP
ncbi:MAG: hypothetical protein WCF23_19535 [Candidatus Nitrosopolaris sp.]